MPKKDKKTKEEINTIVEESNVKADTKESKLAKRKDRIEKKGHVELGSEKIKRREKNIRIIKLGLLIISLFLIIIYFLLRLMYNGGAFTVALDDNLSKSSGLVMYDSLNTKQERKILKADDTEYVDNISINWLPANINNEGEGSHNGENYIAYTFYIENQGADTINYWYSITIDDVIKNADRAIRVMVYRNEEKTVYARPNETTGNAETGTAAFNSNIDVVTTQRKEFKSGDIDKFTIVIWIEGDDPDCVDAIIGGEVKMHMDITAEKTKSSVN